MRSAITVILLSLFVSLASANVLHVPSEYGTIQAGVNAAAEGDTVLVAPGDYDEMIGLGSPSILLKSSGGSAVTIIEGAVRYPYQGSNSSTMDGFTIRKGAITSAGLSSDGNSPRIYNCTVENYSGRYSGGAIDFEHSSCIIRNCRLLNNDYGYGGGIYISGSTGAIVDSCFFQGNDADGIGGAIEMRQSSELIFSNNVVVGNSVIGWRGGVASFDDCTNVSIHNNTIVRNYINGYSDLNGAVGISIVGGSGVEVVNNIVAYNHGSYGISIIGEVSDLRLEYNNVYENDFSQYFGATPGAGSISAFPGFESFQDLNFELRSSSVCIDTGDPSPEYNDPDGTRSDLGAYRVDQSTDTDSDGVLDGVDNCRLLANPGQGDSDSDGEGDLCDACPDDPLNDHDFDGICGSIDPCPLDSLNDIDADGVCGNADNCPFTYNPGQSDIDVDLVGDSCDLCPTISDPWQQDTNNDGVGDACCCLVRGDVDHSGAVNVSDITYLVARLFCGIGPPPCQTEADADDSGTINVSDLTFLVAYLFQGGPASPPCPY